MSHVTEILSQFGKNDGRAAEQLLPVVYQELRHLAAAKLAHEKPGQTLQATALVHEAYLRLIGSEPEPAWCGRKHFFAAAAESMRRILIENARRKQQIKHGGDRQRIGLDGAAAVANASTAQLLELDEALSRLEHEDPIAAGIFKLHYFAGQSVPQAGQTMGVSRSTAYRHWNYARAWLKSQLSAAR